MHCLPCQGFRAQFCLDSNSKGLRRYRSLRRLARFHWVGAAIFYIQYIQEVSPSVSKKELGVNEVFCYRKGASTLDRGRGQNLGAC